MLKDMIAIDLLPFTGSSNELEGYLYGDVPVCVIFFDGGPGSGPKLHRHPYAEVFIVREGQATFTVGNATMELTAGQIAIAQPNQPHKFVNSGRGHLRQIDIHCGPKFQTEWLEEEGDSQPTRPVAIDGGVSKDVIELNQLPHRGSSHLLEGHLNGDVPVSLIFFDGGPRSGPGLHRHPYAEVFILLEGTAVFTVGEETFEMVPGQIAIAQPNQPHKFVNTGEGQLRINSIHCGPRFIQIELEGESH